jgi:hypothetical protein
MSNWHAISLFGRCALRLRQCIRLVRKRGVLSRSSAAGSGPLVAGTGKFMRHVKLRPGTATNAAAPKQAHRCGVLRYKGYSFEQADRRLRGTIPDSDEETEQAIGELAQGRFKDTDGERLQDGCLNTEIRRAHSVPGRTHVSKCKGN